MEISFQSVTSYECHQKKTGKLVRNSHYRRENNFFFFLTASLGICTTACNLWDFGSFETLRLFPPCNMVVMISIWIFYSINARYMKHDTLGTCVTFPLCNKIVVKITIWFIHIWLLHLDRIFSYYRVSKKALVACVQLFFILHCHCLYLGCCIRKEF